MSAVDTGIVKKHGEEPEEPTIESELEKISPAAKEFTVVLGKEPYEQTWTMKPLNFFNKMDFFAEVGKALDSVLASGLSVDELMESVEGDDVQEIVKADAFAKAFAKIVMEVPEVLPELFCIALGVPRGKRAETKTIMELPEELGGLSDATAFNIIDAFTEQNGELLRRFFTEQIVPRVERMMAKRRKAGESAQSRPSRRTRRATQRR